MGRGLELKNYGFSIVKFFWTKVRAGGRPNGREEWANGRAEARADKCKIEQAGERMASWVYERAGERCRTHAAASRDDIIIE